MILTAFAEGSFLLTLITHLHEEYGAKNWGQIYGYMLSSGAAAIAIFDGTLIYFLRETFGDEPNAPQQGINIRISEVLLKPKDFTSYDGWLYLMFAATLAASVVGLFFAFLSLWYHQNHERHHHCSQHEETEMQIVF